MTSQQKVLVAGWPQLFGTKRASLHEMAGINPYATGGMAVNASDVGMSFFDFVDVKGLSYSGTYYFQVQYMPVSAAASKQKPAFTQVKIKFIVAATNAEAANGLDLSGEIFRALFVGL